MNEKVYLCERRNEKKNKITYYFKFYPPITDPHTKKKIKTITSNITLYIKPENSYQRDWNKEMKVKAEIVRCEYQKKLINQASNFIDHSTKNADFLQYIWDIARIKKGKWIPMYHYFTLFMKNSCSFGDLDVQLCEEFRDYLSNTNQLKHKHIPLSRNSASGYFSLFRAALKKAYREKWITENLNEFFDGIKSKQVMREFLSLNELRLLNKTECKYPVLKRAALFSCLTGLRISDILDLEWSHIQPSPIKGHWIKKTIQKTDTQTSKFISDDALELCGERDTGKVFKGLKRSMTNAPLHEWIKSAGIERHITFHCMRHTNATLLNKLGADAVTVKQYLDHAHLSTTQIYTHVDFESQYKAANLIKLEENV